MTAPANSTDRDIAAHDDDPALLTVENLAVRFGSGAARVEAVRGVSFSLHPGRCLAIVGESGSGKSVTARALVGLVGERAEISASVLRFAGTDLLRMSRRRWRRIRGRDIGYVPQAAMVALDPLRPIGREVAEPLRVHRSVPPAEVGARVLTLLTDVGIPEPEVRVGQRPDQLSGGLRQRALIASAIACRPRLLIADEPTTALDVTVQAQILRLLADLKRAGLALLLISHDIAVVGQLADRIAVMHQGRIVEEGPTDQVLRAPRHRYTRQLLEAVPGTRSRSAAGRRPRSADPAPVIQAEGLVKRYRKPGGGTHVAVDGVSVDIRQGETVGLVGESGSGKSTLARMIAGLVVPDGGVVRLAGEPWNPLPERLRRGRRWRLQTIYQDSLSSFDPRHRVGTILSHALRSVGEPGGRAGRRLVDRLLDQVGLDPATANRRPAELSGGQQQRGAIARAIATRPQLIVCDEPVSALDGPVAARILRMLRRLQDETGVAYLFISHHLGVIREVADRVLVMKDGRVVESDEVERLFASPRHPYTRSLLAATPRLDGHGSPGFGTVPTTDGRSWLEEA